MVNKHRIIELAPLPNGIRAHVSSLAQISDNIIAYASQNQSGGIFTFDISTNEWNLVISYSDTDISTQLQYLFGFFERNPWSRVNLAYLPKTDTFYLTPTRHSNPKNGLCPSILTIHRKTKQTKATAVSLHADQTLLGIDGDIHSI